MKNRTLKYYQLKKFNILLGLVLAVLHPGFVYAWLSGGLAISEAAKVSALYAWSNNSIGTGMSKSQYQAWMPQYIFSNPGDWPTHNEAVSFEYMAAKTESYLFELGLAVGAILLVCLLLKTVTRNRKKDNR